MDTFVASYQRLIAQVIEVQELLKQITSHLFPVYHKIHRDEKLRIGQQSAQIQ